MDATTARRPGGAVRGSIDSPWPGAGVTLTRVEAAGTLPGSDIADRLKVLGPATIARLVGRKIEDEGTLALCQAPTYVCSYEGEDGDARYAVVLGQALGRRALMDLLYAIAPYKAHGPDRFARVLDNWRLHDRAKTSSASENLLLQHANSLKLSWHEFARHRDLFIAIFEDEMENTRVVPIVTWQKNPAGIRRWQFDRPDRNLIQVLGESVPVLRGIDGDGAPEVDPLVGLVTIPYFLPELRKNWPAWQPLVKNGKSNYIGPASMPVMSLMHRRALLNSAFVRNAEKSIDTVAIQTSRVMSG